MKSSRRRFLQSACAAPLAATLGGRVLRVSGLAAAGEAPDQFDNPHIIRYDANCFTLKGRDTFIFSAAFHYPRCPQALWGDRLLKLQRAGFNTVETYVFWNYHEPQEGRADLSEFEAFIRLVKQMGFWMIARPGPYVCAEWDVGGFPHWVVAKRFPLRSNHPESVRTSQHWFSLVLPVIQRHQVTTGGPIIMVQLENEYDYFRGVENSERREYLRALAHMAWDAGINVPLITCWTKQARENSDADMALIMDTCNFYPRWNILKQVPPALKKLRQEEPQTPLGITELQGGWFSEFGGKLSVDQEGVDDAQLNMLSKTAIEQGVTYFNYYMGFGGTNFDWGAKRMTTTYDYAAPVREPGGLWEKYYAARGIGASLGILGNVLTRAKPTGDGVQSTNAQVSVSEREGGRSGVVFVRENAGAEQRFKMTFRDPASPTRRAIAVPRQGELTIGAREMKMLPVQVAIAGGQLRYSTAEILAHGLVLDRHFVILYDEPGRLVELALATRDEPRVEGETLYQYWDPEYESVVIGLNVENEEKNLLVNNHILVVIAPRWRALQAWVAEFPSQVVPGAEETKPMAVPFITHAALLASSGSTKKTIWAELDFRRGDSAPTPGEHRLTVLLPPKPSVCRVDGSPVEFQYDRERRATRLSVPALPLPVRSFALNEVQTWIDKFVANQGRWLDGPLAALEDLGPIPYGYVKYQAQFTPSGPTPKIFISSFADDAKKVFLNGRLVDDASNNKKVAEFALPGGATSRTQRLEIAYELFGSPNFGEKIGELKGIESVRVGTEAQSAALIESWKIQPFPPAMRGRMIDPEFAAGRWTRTLLPEFSSGLGMELVPAFTWCRAEFTLPAVPSNWTVPWKVTFEAERDALLYLNGKFIGRYVTVGPQKDFYLPEPYFLSDVKRKNVLTVMLAYTADAHPIRTLRIGPYEEFSTHRTRVEFEW